MMDVLMKWFAAQQVLQGLMCTWIQSSTVSRRRSHLIRITAACHVTPIGVVRVGVKLPQGHDGLLRWGHRPEVEVTADCFI